MYNSMNRVYTNSNIFYFSFVSFTPLHEHIHTHSAVLILFVCFIHEIAQFAFRCVFFEFWFKCVLVKRLECKRLFFFCLPLFAKRCVVMHVSGGIR